MLKTICLLAAGGALWAADPAAFKTASDLAAALKKRIETGTAQASAPIANEPRYRVNIVHRGKPGVAMAHATGPAKGTEVHYIIEGAATVVTGGTLVSAAAIENGVARHVAKGDVVVIPAGTPHWYKEVDGSVTYLEVRFDVELK